MERTGADQERAFQRRHSKPALTPPQALEELAMVFQTKASLASDSIGSNATSSPQTAFVVAQPGLQTQQATPSAADDGQAASSTQVGAGGLSDVEDDTLETLSARTNATELADVRDVLLKRFLTLSQRQDLHRCRWNRQIFLMW